jgi:adiponectin receptor
MASAAASFLPALYYILKYGTVHLPHVYDNPAFLNLGFMLLQYFLGGLVYASRFPEWLFFTKISLSPGRFDYIGHSHQLWHILVLSATMTLYNAINGLIIWRLENENMCHALIIVP